MHTRERERGLSLGLALVFFTVASPASARLALDEGPSVVRLGVAYARADGQAVDEKLDGWGVSAGIDEISYDGRYALGFAFTYFGASSSRAESGGDVQYHYRAIPVRVTTKMFLGNPRGRGVGYLGAGIGVGFNRLERTTALTTTATYSSAVSAGLTVGGLVAFGGKHMVDVGYTFNFLNDSFFTDDLAHVVTLAVGFRR